LRFARSLTFDEAMSLLSGVRLAAGLQLVQGLSVYTLNKLLIFSQPAHLAAAEGGGGRELTEAETDIARARFVRQTLADEVGPIQ
jgi:protein arginine kinase